MDMEDENVFNPQIVEIDPRLHLEGLKNVDGLNLPNKVPGDLNLKNLEKKSKTQIIEECMEKQASGLPLDQWEQELLKELGMGAPDATLEDKPKAR